MTVIKGKITTATGDPVSGATIALTALQTTSSMLRSITTCVTTTQGEYDFTVTPGVYSVRLSQNGTGGFELGSVHIYDDSPDGTLNSFLNAKNIDTRPEALRQFEALVKQATDSAGQAGDSEAAARDSAGQAAISEQTATTAAATATTAAGTATGAAQQAATSEQHASQSEKNAAASEATATQAVRDSTAARDEVVRQVTGFDTHVRQQTDTFTKAAQDATTKAGGDITAAAETVKQAIQTQGQRFVDAAHTEATGASRSALDAQAAGQAAQQAKTDTQAALKDTLTATQSAMEAESNALKASQEAQDAAKTPVMTDGTTITGDGKTSPLALGPGTSGGIGSYLFAYSSGWEVSCSYGDLVPANILAAGVASSSGGYMGTNNYMVNLTRRPSGTWRVCGEAIRKSGSGRDLCLTLYQRVL
ncbi:prophage tail fiber N-terminal domain-containing protein [Salmonella enterica]|nr:prophage tail fiber N-terminal domain-containing protein [Salmonella enterica]